MTGPTRRRAGVETPRERAAWTRGRDRAAAVVRDHGTADPERLAAAAGVEIVEDDWSGVGSLTLLGTYADGTVTLYREQIRSVAVAHDVPERQLVTGILAHELGHHFVDASTVDGQTDRGIVGSIDSLLGVERVPTTVQEAAANGFCFALLEARFDESLLLDRPEILTAPSMA